jgi:hypothetical protein
MLPDSLRDIEPLFLQRLKSRVTDAKDVKVTQQNLAFALFFCAILDELRNSGDFFNATRILTYIFAEDDMNCH